MPRYNPILDELAVYHQQKSEERKQKVREAGIQLLDFSVGDPKEPVPEFIRNALKDAVPPNCRYPSVAGKRSVREAMAGYVQRRFAVDLDPDQHVLPLSGAKEGVFHIPQLVIDPKAEDRVVLYPDPGYPVCHRGALFAGGEPVAIPLSGDYIFRPWELEDDLLRKCRLLWINSPHNPSGAVMSLEDLERTAELCRNHDILLVSDECYADIYSVDAEAPHSILECGLDNVLALFSLSKRSGMTGYRSGFIAGDASVIAQFKKYRSNPGVVPQSFVNAAAELAWSEDSHVEERRRIFSEKKELFIRFFDSIGWEIIGKEASLYLWIKLPEGSSSAEWTDRLLSKGVVVSSGDMFALTEAGDGYLRIAMVPSLEECRRAIQIWNQLL